jgi:hypothetical protein
MGAASHLGIDLRDYDTRIRTFIPGYERLLEVASAVLAATVLRARRSSWTSARAPGSAPVEARLQ